MQKLTLRWCFMAMIAIFPVVAAAEPAGDAAIIAKLVKQLQEMKKQYSLMRDAYNVANRQLDTLDKQKKILEDAQNLKKYRSEYGNKYSNDSLRHWQHSGNNWDSLLDIHKSGTSDPLHNLAKSIEKEFPIATADNIYSPSKNREQARLFDLLSSANLASRAGSTLAYNSVDEELKMLEFLQQEIGKSPNEKATLDLIARIQIETAKLAAFKIKADAASSQITGLRTQQELTEAKIASDFFNWH